MQVYKYAAYMTLIRFSFNLSPSQGVIVAFFPSAAQTERAINYNDRSGIAAVFTALLLGHSV